jgi:large repetitive protein
LTFKYVVASGQNTSDLAVTGVSLNSATIKDGAGNAANLSRAVTNPAGTLQVRATAVANTVSHTPTAVTATNQASSTPSDQGSAQLSVVGHQDAVANATQSAIGQTGSSSADSPSSGSGSPSLAALDHRLALWTQYMASTLPSSAFSHGDSLMGGASGLGDSHQSSQVANPIASHQRVPSAGIA